MRAYKYRWTVWDENGLAVAEGWTFDAVLSAKMTLHAIMTMDAAKGSDGVVGGIQLEMEMGGLE
jgi:hypothetical protein